MRGVVSVILGTSAWAVAGACSAQPVPNPSFSLVNRGTQAINEIYATPAGVDRWGRDRLGSSLITPGMAFPVRLPADGNCLYDIRVVFADGRPEERRRVNTCQVELLTFPSGVGANEGGGRADRVSNDPSFRLVNRSRSPVNALYVTAPSVDGWGQDLLGEGTVVAGGTFVVRLPRGECTFDVRVVFANGEASEKRRVDLCRLTDLRVP